jgi:hypothetical protein
VRRIAQERETTLTPARQRRQVMDFQVLQLRLDEALDEGGDRGWPAAEQFRKSAPKRSAGLAQISRGRIGLASR